MLLMKMDVIFVLLRRRLVFERGARWNSKNFVKHVVPIPNTGVNSVPSHDRNSNKQQQKLVGSRRMDDEKGWYDDQIRWILLPTTTVALPRAFRRRRVAKRSGSQAWVWGLKPNMQLLMVVTGTLCSTPPHCVRIRYTQTRYFNRS